MRPGLRLQPLTRGKVAALGEPGRAWLAALPQVLTELAERWDLVLGRPLPGGSASYVCAAETSSGLARVVKVAVPDPDLADGSRVLRAARGRGYAVLHDADPGRRALLLERLGPSLELSGLPVELVLDHLADTLLEAWRVPLEAGVPAPGRAEVLLETLLGRAGALPGACTPAALAAAGAAAHRLAGTDPDREVVVHGDPHPGNALRVPDPVPGRTAWVLVDPDGLRGDPALDLGVALRDFSTHLTGSDARDRLWTWCVRVGERCGVEPARVSDWACLERVSTGLYVASLGAERLSRRFLDSAAALAREQG